MKRKKAKKYFNTDVWFSTNLSDYILNLSKFNSKKGEIVKKYNIDAEILNYIVDDFQVFDRIQFGEMIDMNLDDNYTNTLLLMLKENVFEQFCDIAHFTQELSCYEKELDVFYNSLSKDKQNEFNKIWKSNSISVIDEVAAASYNDLFELVNCKDTVLFLMMMDARIENESILIGNHDMLKGGNKNKHFNISPSNDFNINNILLPNGERFTYKKWKELQDGK